MGRALCRSSPILQNLLHPRAGGFLGFVLCELGFQTHEKRLVVVAEFLNQEGRHLLGGLQPGCVDGPAGRCRCKCV